MTWIIEKGKALLAAVGIGGKKDEKKAQEGGTAHEQAVRDVALQLSEAPPGDPLPYSELRKAKEAEAATIAAARNQSLAAEHVRMTVTFADAKSDAADHDIDFKVRIAPNDANAAGATPVSVPEPVAGQHVVTRPAPFAHVGGESHHVPAKGLGTGIGRFLGDVAEKLQGGEWKGDPAAIAVADAFAKRGVVNCDAAKEPGIGLSAILMCPEAHTEEGGVHTVSGSGPVLHAIAENPKGKAIVMVKRRTATVIHGAMSYLSVNPQIRSWKLFLADVHRAVHDVTFQNQHSVKPSEVVGAQGLHGALREAADGSAHLATLVGVPASADLLVASWKSALRRLALPAHSPLHGLLAPPAPRLAMPARIGT